MTWGDVVGGLLGGAVAGVVGGIVFGAAIVAWARSKMPARK